MDDDTQVETDRTTTAERVPVDGAYNITTLGDSLRIGWWEGRNRSIRWRNLRWWVLGAVLVAFPVWVILWAPFRLSVIVAIAVVCAYPTAKAVGWYVELADKWASVQVKRKQTRAGRGH